MRSGAEESGGKVPDFADHSAKLDGRRKKESPSSLSLSLSPSSGVITDVNAACVHVRRQHLTCQSEN